MYADGEVKGVMRQAVGLQATSVEAAAKRFQQQKQRPEYQALLHSRAQVIGVWDDHDYGCNDGDERNPIKEEVKTLFLDFLDESADSQRRNPGRGLYSSYSWAVANTDGSAESTKGTAGFQVVEGNDVKLILLDNRFGHNRARADFLGEEQWKWLEQELSRGHPHLTVIGAGIQILSWDKRMITESFSNYPQTRARLLQLVTDASREGMNSGKGGAVLFMSGDVHMAELHQTQACSWAAADGWYGQSLYDFTTSGFSHAVGDFNGRFPTWLQPWFRTHLLPTATTWYRALVSRDSLASYLDKNFATLTIQLPNDADSHGSVQVDVHSLEGVAISRSFSLTDLQPKPLGSTGSADIPPACAKERERALASISRRPLVLFLGLFFCFVGAVVCVFVWLLWLLYRCCCSRTHPSTEKKNR